MLPCLVMTSPRAKGAYCSRSAISASRLPTGRRRGRRRAASRRRRVELALPHGLGVRLVARDGVHRALRLGDADAGALQRGEQVHAHHRVGGVVLHEVGEEVAQLVAQVALRRSRTARSSARRARDVGDRQLAHLVVDDGDHARRRHARVDHEVEDAAPLQRRAFALAEDRDARLSSACCSAPPRFPSCASRSGSSASGCRAPGRSTSSTRDPVADLHRVVELDGEAAEHVAKGVLHGEGDHRGEDRGGGDEARRGRGRRRAAARSRRPRRRR